MADAESRRITENSTETISHEEWAVDNFFTVFRYKWVSNITEYWGHTVESNVDFNTVSETPDVYKELQYRVSEFANSELDWGFTIGTYKFEEVIIVLDVAAHYNRRVNGIAYATKPSAPEIKVSFSKIMLTLDVFDR